jgi:hypothetical protein
MGGASKPLIVDRAVQRKAAKVARLVEIRSDLEETLAQAMPKRAAVALVQDFEDAVRWDEAGY